MIRCVKCGEVSGIAKTGKVRNNQRYYCKLCDYYFTFKEVSHELKTPQKHQTTIIDIAKQLNISKSTVSRALHGSADVSDKTRESVLKLAQRLNYVPNQFASGLSKKRSYTIAIVVPELINNFFPQFIIAAQEKADKAGYSVLFFHSNESLRSETDIIDLLLANQVDGVILSITRETTNLEHLKKIQKCNIPLILFNRYISSQKIPKVIVNDFEGAFKAVEHLIENGYKRIAHIGGPLPLQTSINRLEGYKAALKKHNLPVDKNLIVHHDLSKTGSRKCAEKLLNLPKLPDAVFAMNDPAAIELMLLARERMIHIPEDLGVVGFSNDFRSEIISPTLTTLAQPLEEMAQCAIDLLVKKIEHPDQKIPVLTTLTTKLIVRSSSVR